MYITIHKMAKPKLKQISTYVEESKYEELKKKAQLENRTISNYLSVIIKKTPEVVSSN